MGAGVLAFVGGAEMKLTEWYPGDVKPARPGVYQQKAYGAIGYKKWSGRYWSCWYKLPEQAAKCNFVSSFKNDPWRGLAQNPKGSKK